MSVFKNQMSEMNQNNVIINKFSKHFEHFKAYFSTILSQIAANAIRFGLQPRGHTLIYYVRECGSRMKILKSETFSENARRHKITKT